MLRNFKYLFLLIGIFHVVSETKGQVAKSPFSSYGIGELYGNSLVHNQGMAGVGISNPQYFFLNNQNPALLVFNRFTVFEAGYIGEKKTIRGSGASEKSINGNLNYLVTAFPIKLGRWSTSVGLMPYSSVNYQINYTENINGSENTVDVVQLGKGGINQFFWSHGISLNKYFSVGVKATYLFSSIQYEYLNRLTTSAQPTTYFPKIIERNYVRDFNFSAGFSFHKDSIGANNNKLYIGLVYDFKADINSNYNARMERNNVAGLVDSVTLVNDKGQATIPSTLAGGISFAKGDALVVGVDYTYMDYTTFKYFNGQPEPYGTSGFKLAAGAEFTPDPTGLRSYIKRITYRTGVNYDKYPYLINGKPVYDFGINFGFSLPVARISSLDLALKVGKRGNLSDNTIEENYFKIYFGVTFNDQWFIRRRFD